MLATLLTGSPRRNPGLWAWLNSPRRKDVSIIDSMGRG